MSKELSQMNVSEDLEKNKKFSDSERLANLEADIIHVSDVMGSLVIQNNKYAQYLDERIAIEKESHEFWLDVRKKLITSGIWGTILIIGSALLYAAKHWVNNN